MNTDRAQLAALGARLRQPPPADVPAVALPLSQWRALAREYAGYGDDRLARRRQAALLDTVLSRLEELRP